VSNPFKFAALVLAAIFVLLVTVDVTGETPSPLNVPTAVAKDSCQDKTKTKTKKTEGKSGPYSNESDAKRKALAVAEKTKPKCKDLVGNPPQCTNGCKSTGVARGKLSEADPEYKQISCPHGTPKSNVCFKAIIFWACIATRDCVTK
jgi:hypothetical protein